jgi:ribosomal-protein-alanine N-acetyltransferase
MSEFIVRASTPFDLSAILQIERANPTAAHWSESEYVKLWNNSEREWIGVVAESEGAVIGFAIAREVVVERGVSHEWELENIAVSPGFQGKGVGTALLREVWARIEPLPASCRVILEVRESNFAARKLYERQGFQVSGRRKNYYQNPAEDALLFQKIFPDLSMKIR